MLKRLIGLTLATVISVASSSLLAEDSVPSKTIEQLYAQKSDLAGKRVQVSGEVVKVNNNIMGKNFLHLKDGTGSKGTDDITITSQQTAQIGDKVKVEALVTLNRDFGMGYSYPLILEEATISPAK